MELTRQKVFKDSIYTSISTFYSSIAQSIRGLLIGKILGPQLLGVWSNLLLILYYGNNLHLGTLVVLTREYPYLKKRGEIHKSDSIIFDAITYNVGIGIIFFIGVLLYVLFFHKKHNLIFNLGLVVIGFLVLLQRIFEVYNKIIRANDDFKSLARIGILFGTLNLVSAVVLTYYYKLVGIYISVLLTYIICNLFAARFQEYKLRFHFDFRRIWKLIFEGAPLFILNFLYIVVRSADKIMILIFLAHLQLGFYHMSIMFCDFILMIPMVISSVLFPKFVIKRADYEHNYLLYSKYIFVPTEIVTYFSSFSILILVLILPALVYRFLNEYLPIIDLLNILLIGTYFLSFMWVSNDFLISVKKHNKVIYFYIYSVLLNIVLNYIFIKMGYGINGVSLATSITFFILSISIIFYSHYLILGKVYKVMLRYLLYTLPLCYNFIVLILTKYFLMEKFEILDKFYFGMIIAILFQLPLFLYLNKKYSLIELIIKRGR